jgi:hypothetical protein
MKNASPAAAKRTPLNLRWLLVVLIPLLFLGFAHLATFAQLDSRIPKETAAALDRAASYLVDQPGLETHLLQSVGYEHPGILDDVWRQMAPVHRLEAAYLSAEAQAAGSGERMLALMSRAMAQQYEGARYDSVLRPYLQQPAPTPVQFAPLTDQNLAKLRANMSVKARGVIERLALYSETTSLGPYQILTSYFGLEDAASRHVLYTTRTTNEALASAMLLVPEAQRDEAMRRLVRDLDAISDTARRDAAFDPWRRRVQERATPEAPFRWTRGDGPGGWSPNQGPDRPPPDLPKFDPGKGPPPRPTLGGGGGGVALNPTIKKSWSEFRIREYGKFVRVNYPKPVQFRTMIRRAGGFGGIVLGNDVVGEPFSKVSTLRWRKGPADVGVLTCLVNNQENVLEHVPHEIVYAAHDLVFNFKAFERQPDDTSPGVGLVGIADQSPYFECGPNRIVHEGRRCYFVLHPAIAQFKLGWSLTLCDAFFFPELRPILIGRIRESQPLEAEAFDGFFKQAKRTWDTYKYFDVPVEIRASNGKIQVARQIGNGKFAPELRDSCYFTLFLHKFDDIGKSKEDFWDTDEEFYSRVPALLKASQDHQQLNELIRVVAFLRWAKERGATFADPIDPPSFRPQTGSIIITNQGVTPAPIAKRSQALAELRQKVEKRLAGMAVNGSPAVRQMIQDYQKSARQEWLSHLKNQNVRSIGEPLRLAKNLHLKVTACLVSSVMPTQESNYWADLQDKLIDLQLGELLTSQAQPTPTSLENLPSATLHAGELIGVETEHRVKMTKGNFYQADLISTDFDAFLNIKNQFNVKLKEDDDGGEGTNARLFFVPSESSEYRFGVTSFKSVGRGAYRLYVQEWSPGSIVLNVSGKFDGTPFRDQGLPIWSEIIDRAEANNLYRVDFNPETANSVLMVRDSAGAIVAISRSQPEPIFVKILTDGLHEISLAPTSGETNGGFKFTVTKMNPTGAVGTDRIDPKASGDVKKESSDQKPDATDAKKKKADDGRSATANPWIWIGVAVFVVVVVIVVRMRAKPNR